MARDCYAEKIGGCGGGISREHVFSECVLEDSVRFVGAKRMPSVMIGKANAVIRILCRNHNSALSDFDTEAEKMFSALSYVSHVLREGKAGEYFPRMRHDRIDASRIERWLAKTAINLSYVQGGNHKYLSERLLDYLFNGKKFEYPYGMWMSGEISDTDLLSDDYLAIDSSPLIMEGDHELGGYVFRIKGLRFILWFPWLAPARITEGARVHGENDVTAAVDGSYIWHSPMTEICAVREIDDQSVPVQRIAWEFSST